MGSDQRFTDTARSARSQLEPEIRAIRVIRVPYGEIRVIRVPSQKIRVIRVP